MRMSLYGNLDWLASAQAAIEDRLYAQRTKSKSPSSCFCMMLRVATWKVHHNELAAFGYNRDGKKGEAPDCHRLTLRRGRSILSLSKCFPAIPQDATDLCFATQEGQGPRFGVHEITFVGDRGMIKGQQIEDLAQQGLHYITSLPKPQIEKLLRTGILQLDLFDQEVAEVLAEEGIRYVLRRNPVRAQEVLGHPAPKLATLQTQAPSSTFYLTEHPACPCPGSFAQARGPRPNTCASLDWVEFTFEDRAITLTVNTPCAAKKPPNSMAAMC